MFQPLFDAHTRYNKPAPCTFVSGQQCRIPQFIVWCVCFADKFAAFALPFLLQARGTSVADLRLIVSYKPNW